jgi:hypothetical protein
MSLLSESTTCGAVIVLLQLKVEKLAPFPFGSNKKRFETPDRTIMFDFKGDNLGRLHEINNE